MKNFYFLAAGLLLLGCGKQPKSEATEKAGEGLNTNRAAEARPADDDRPAIVAFGDSLSSGHGAGEGNSYPDFLEQQLKRRGYSYRVINAGISGDTTSGGLARLSTVLSYQPAIVILELGGNDGLRGLPVSVTRLNLEQIIVGLRKAGARVVLAGMTLPPNYGPDYIRSFELVFTELAAKYKLPLIPFLLEGVGGTTEYMQDDGIHPTAEGNLRGAANVMKVLEPLLKKQR